MAYGTSAQMDTLLGKTLFDALCTMAGTQTTADVYAQARADADAEIDAALAQVYTVPFAAVGDTPATPAIITTVSNNLTAAYLYRKRHPQGGDHKTYREEAERILERLIAGTYEIPGAAKVDADEGSVGVAYLEDDGAEPIFAGTDSDGNCRMKNW